ncbi:hypothetical protein GC173_03965 [bacterium]|nr:hypothetical protein [bacterium]
MLLLVLLFFLIRILWENVYPARLHGDTAEYARLARNLSAYGVYGEGLVAQHYWPPLWPVVLSLFDPNRAILGYSPWTIVCWVLSCGTMLLHYRTLLVAWAGHRSAAVAVAVLFIVNPSHVLMSNTLATEHLFGLLFAGACLGILVGLNALADSGRIPLPISLCSGASLGLSLLTRPVLLPFLGVLAGLALYGVWQRRWNAVLPCVLTVCVALLPVALWNRRNIDVTGDSVMISSNGGVNIWFGANDYLYDPGWHLPPEGSPAVAIDAMPAAMADREYKAASWGYIRQNPAAWAGKGLKKMEDLFRIDPAGLALRWDWFKIVDKNHYNVFRGLNGLILYAALFGCVLLVTFRWIVPVPDQLTERGLAVMLGAVGLILLTTFLTWGMPRYRYPIDPYLWALAFSGFARCLTLRRQMRRGL